MNPDRTLPKFAFSAESSEVVAEEEGPASFFHLYTSPFAEKKIRTAKGEGSLGKGVNNQQLPGLLVLEERHDLGLWSRHMSVQPRGPEK